jgi:hypothetical protein
VPPAESALAGAEEVSVLIVAGQSNVLNWHADAAQLPASAADDTIRFYFHTGAPPSKAPDQPFNATSSGEWTALAPQKQHPYRAYHRRFFGPEMSLARSLARSERQLAVIKIGYFGTNLAEDWRPDAATGNRLYALLMSEVSHALGLLRTEGRAVRLLGFFWMQGETDANVPAHAAAYADNLGAFIARVRADLGAPEMPFVLGRVGPPPPKGYASQAVVRQAQVTVAATVAGVAWVDTDDLPRDADGIHLLAPGVIALGERWAGAWHELARH